MLAQYEPFWYEWIFYRFNELNADEIVLITSIYKKKVIGQRVSTINEPLQSRLTPELLDKLKKTDHEYRLWASNRFIFSLLRLTDSKNVQEFIAMPFHLWSIPDNLKTILLKFECMNLSHFFYQYDEKRLAEEPFFTHVLEYQKESNKKRKAEYYMTNN